MKLLRFFDKFESLREIPDGLRGIVRSQDAVSAVVGRALARQGRVLWVTPQRPSLEEFFTS
jgi:hypothetical protein